MDSVLRDQRHDFTRMDFICMIGPAMDGAEWPSAGYTNAGYVYKPKDNLYSSQGYGIFLAPASTVFFQYFSLRPPLSH